MATLGIILCGLCVVGMAVFLYAIETAEEVDPKEPFLNSDFI